jgi:hypothetical protein
MRAKRPDVAAENPHKGSQHRADTEHECTRKLWHSIELDRCDNCRGEDCAENEQVTPHAPECLAPHRAELSAAPSPGLRVPIRLGAMALVFDGFSLRPIKPWPP